jgi:hypothetical protein
LSLAQGCSAPSRASHRMSFPGCTASGICLACLNTTGCRSRHAPASLDHSRRATCCSTHLWITSKGSASSSPTSWSILSCRCAMAELQASKPSRYASRTLKCHELGKWDPYSEASAGQPPRRAALWLGSHFPFTYSSSAIRKGYSQSFRAGAEMATACASLRSLGCSWCPPRLLALA